MGELGSKSIIVSTWRHHREEHCQFLSVASRLLKREIAAVCLIYINGGQLLSSTCRNQLIGRLSPTYLRTNTPMRKQLAVTSLGQHSLL